jgi:hypothetical protein
VLRFDNKGNLIQIVPGTSSVGPATIERDSWRREWWCAEPAVEVNEWLNYNDPASVRRFEERRSQAAIKCNHQRREWCVNHPADPSESYQDPGVITLAAGDASGASDTRPTSR